MMPCTMAGDCWGIMVSRGAASPSTSFSAWQPMPIDPSEQIVTLKKSSPEQAETEGRLAEKGTRPKHVLGSLERLCWAAKLHIIPQNCAREIGFFE